jgi:hypothetical protein
MRLTLSCAGLAFFLMSAWSGAANAALELLMFEQPGCIYCAQWNREIASKYPLTTEGKLVPLRRLDIHSDVPAEIALRSRPVFTPTFVLLEDGSEVDRIEGYPGEDFFWSLLDAMIAKTSEPLPGE